MRQSKRSSKLQNDTKNSLNLTPKSPELSWLVGDKAAMIERRRVKLAAAGVEACPFCGGCIWLINGSKVCGDGCTRIR